MELHNGMSNGGDLDNSVCLLTGNAAYIFNRLTPFVNHLSDHSYICVVDLLSKCLVTSEQIRPVSRMASSKEW